MMPAIYRNRVLELAEIVIKKLSGGMPQAGDHPMPDPYARCAVSR